MLFKIFRIKKMITQGMRDPGGLAGEEAAGALTALLILPGIGALIWLALMFILGFTPLLGGPFGFFKFVFVVSFIGVLGIGIVLYKIIRAAGRFARKTTERVIGRGDAKDAAFTVKK